MNIGQKEHWDRRAAEFQRKFLDGENEYNKKLLEFWTENGMIKEGMRTVDIGCGVGRYGVLLGNFGCEVSLTDISEEMLRYSEENMLKSRPKLPFHTYRCDFAEATGKEEFFKKGFDFSIACMSPAINDFESIRKMSDMTKGYCFVTRFVKREQPLKEEIISELGLSFPESERFVSGVEEITEAVRKMSFEPQLKYVDYNWSDEKSPEVLAKDILKGWFSERGEDNAAELEKQVFEIAADIKNKRGTLIDEVFSKVVWLYWQTK